MRLSPPLDKIAKIVYNNRVKDLGGAPGIIKYLITQMLYPLQSLIPPRAEIIYGGQNEKFS